MDTRPASPMMAKNGNPRHTLTANAAAKHALKHHGDGGEDERVVDGLPEDLVAEDVAVVLQPDEAARRPHPIVGEAEVDGHPERIGHEADDEHERGDDQAVTEDGFVLPPLTHTREATGPGAPGRLKNALADGHVRRPCPSSRACPAPRA